AKARVGGVSARAWSVAGAGAMWVPVIARPEPTVATRQSLAETHEPATGGGCVGNPRWTRIFATTAGSVRNASTRRRPPHSLHRRTSMARTRARSAAQSRRRARIVAGTRAGVGKEVDDSSLVPGGAGGTISARPAALGAKTPWYLVRCRRGGGIGVARRPRNSRGVRTS